MKVTGIISALIFAHVALGQATDSTSSAVSSVSGTKSANAATATTKTGTKSASASTSSVPDATPTGSSGSTSSIGDLTESTTDPLIPTGISDTCSTFLNSLNSDTTVANCLASLNTALSAFTSGSGSYSAASKAVTSLCATNACATSVMRPKLTEFKDACSDELSSNDMVLKQYDTWYWLIPFKDAICTKDDTTQDYCSLITGSTTSNSSNTRRSDVSYAAGHLTKRAQTVLMPNADTYRNSNLMYMFISPSMPADQLCTSCARKIMTKYTAQGYAVPYALGATKSKLLGQTDIWAAVTDKCSPDFVSQIKNDAGVTDTDQLANGAITTTASYFTALTAAFAAAFAFF